MDDEIEIYFCPLCGGIEWEEVIRGVSIYYTINENGEAIELDRDYWGDTEIVCPYCDGYVFSLYLKKDEVREFVKMEPMDRIVYVLKQMADGREMTEDDGHFVKVVMDKWSRDEEFMKKASAYLIALGLKD